MSGSPDLSQPDCEGVPRFRAFVGLGGNLGDVRACFESALRAINRLPATRIEAVSSLYRTVPVDATGPDFLNAVACVQTALGPHELLRALQAIELDHARLRPHVNAPRTLDLDLLHHGDACFQTPTLTLPHPRQGDRAFVLVPMSELLTGPLASAGAASASGPGCQLHLPEASELARLVKLQGVERLPDRISVDRL